MRTYKFTSTTFVEAESMEEAKEEFANNSYNFAAEAEIEEVFGSKIKVEVLLTTGKATTILLTVEKYNNLKNEMAGDKTYISEYETIDGKIITDLEIQSIDLN